MQDWTFSKYDIQREIRLPKKSKELSEFIGILFGDGYIIERGRIHRIGITLNATEDRFYFQHVKELIKRLFNLKVEGKPRKNQNTLDIVIHSKGIANFLLLMGLPNGSKKDRLHIPNWILEKKGLLKSFLRGLMDTDGSLFFAKRGTYKQNQYPVIEIKIHDKKFVNELEKSLKNLGFSCFKTKFKVQLNGKKELERWKDEINMENMNNLSRYFIWKRFNYCPPKTKLDERLEMLGWQKLAHKLKRPCAT